MSPQIQPYRPTLRGAFKYAILSAFIWVFSAISATGQPIPPRGGAEGGGVSLILPGQSITPGDTSVLMNFATFTSYYLAQKQVDTLRLLLPAYKLLADSLREVYENTVDNFRAIVDDQDLIIDNQEQVITNRKKEIGILEKDVKRQKTKTRITGGVGILAILGLLLL